MKTPQGPGPQTTGWRLVFFLRHNPARHRAAAAVALMVVAGATVSASCDPLRLRALVIVAFITALLVIADLFTLPAQQYAAARRASASEMASRKHSHEIGPSAPACDACGLPMVHARNFPYQAMRSLFWPEGSDDQATMALLGLRQARANDDGTCLSAGEEAVGWLSVLKPVADVDAQSAPLDVYGEAGSGVVRSRRAKAAAELCAGEGLKDLTPFRRSYAGSRLKSALDLAGASLLLIGLLPLMLAISCLLATFGGRPVLVHQNRVDWSGARFKVSRFRSNALLEVPKAAGQDIAGACRTPQYAARIESILYRTGLASLPLLLSVVRGDLSFVGPDPATPRLSRRDRLGAAIVADIAARIGAKPGLTGWAEVNAARRSGRAMTARQKIACDLYYLENSSPLLDLRILVRAVDSLASGTQGS